MYVHFTSCVYEVAMRAMSGCDSASTFSHFEKIATLQILKNKIDELADMQKQPQEVFCKICVLRNLAKFTGKHLYQSLFFNEVAGSRGKFIKKKILTQVFSREFCQIYKKTFLTEHLQATASGYDRLR